ncbi:MAG: hypothetical protein JW788_01665 [Candidatus Omnitrophica bacterium]|nr:hypothetical protein [Candidatus Omnitrophota bacterium]
MSKKKNIILGVCASIAIYKACELIRRLRENGFDPTVVMTEEAKEMIRPVVFQSLSANPVYCGMFETVDSWKANHISLAERADLVLIAPATANVIAKVSLGICDDLLTCLCCATKAPILICPAMNTNMYENRITQENIRRLKGLGYKFVGPKSGKLACGETGTGCLAEIDKIVGQVKRLV